MPYSKNFLELLTNLEKKYLNKPVPKKWGHNTIDRR